ncbi:sigma-70 family RNA polymerase sigma factor [Tunicatimonas pelagia]|uniref:sigma-70 family RNA polymerase sigma factor n=1 Tax=Tunicatimonas pelagia TaxID=931531 RepID=UPI00266599D6|nr:RNA polymerase sigma factor RpoD/SigA [Tunicatimonas pelagia]WKN43298.1 RNA polymerase sigma factor RpoD/SigA [Tunicatimonas pelagia]
MKQLKISKQITNRESQALDKYFADIGRMGLISPEEEATLAKKIREGDQQALEKLTKANLRFVVSVAKQYQSSKLSLGDLINEGNVGLIKAAQRFDETRGFKFISYAVWWIRQSITQAIAEQSRVVHLPLNRINSLSKITKVFSELEQKSHRSPTITEIAESTEMTEEEVSFNLSISHSYLSLDAPFVDGEENRLLDILENKDEVTDANMIISSLRKELEIALSALTEKEANILTQHFGLDGEKAMTLEDIGKKYNLTRERVRQIKEKATRRLRNSPRNHLLKMYLG